jgi:hypothetical protein
MVYTMISSIHPALDGQRYEPGHPNYGKMLSQGERLREAGFRLHWNVISGQDGKVDYDQLNSEEARLQQLLGDDNVVVLDEGYHLNGGVNSEIEHSVWVRDPEGVLNQDS